MITRVQKWGNSLSLRIPKPFAVQLGLEENTPINISIEDGKLILWPQRYSLEALLSAINESNLHHEVDSGDAMGNEVW
jgi:antitoxin MazE